MIANAPKPAAPRPIAVSPVSETMLDNGLRVIVAPRPGIPLIAGQMLFRNGAVYDEPAKAGISSLAAMLLGYGSERLPSEQFSAAIEAIGASFSGSAGYESMSAGVSSLRDLFGEALQLSAEAIMNPACTAEDLERIRARVVSDIRVSMSSSGSLARLIAGRVIFGEHPYGIPLGGTSESIETLQLPELRTVLSDRMFPDGSCLILVGDLSPNEGFAYARTVFAGWQKVAAYAPAAVRPVPAAQARRILVDLPDSGRSAVIIGKRAPARSDARYLAATVLNGLLSGYSGRLNREIRVKRGLSYGAGAGFHARRLAGSMLASTMVEHARVGETIAVIGDVFADVAANAPSEEELQTRKATLRGAFGRTLETVGGLAGMVGSRVMYDLPSDELETYLARLEAITPQEVVAVAADFLAGGALQIIVVGDAAAVKAGAPGIDFEEHSADAIELRHASLLQEEL